MSAGVKRFMVGYAVFLGMVVLTNVFTRPVARRVATAANVPQLGNIL